MTGSRPFFNRVESLRGIGALAVAGYHMTGGVLHAGDRLPSSRDLAVTLGVSRTVVTNAYARLFAEGWLRLTR